MNTKHIRGYKTKYISKETVQKKLLMVYKKFHIKC